jgi:hypothetical protein
MTPQSMPPALPAPALRARGWLALIAALVVLNAALSFHNQWPTPWVTLRWELSVEVALLLLALALAAEVRPARAPGRVTALLAAMLTILCLGRYAEVTAPALYGRRINLYWDGQHLPRVAAMLAQAAPAWMTAAALAGAAALVAAVFALLRWALHRVGDALPRPGPRRFLAALGSALVLLYAAGSIIGDLPTRRWFSLPVVRTYAEQGAMLYRALRGGPVQADLDAAPLPGSGLSALSGADVVLVFLESYGATAFDDPRHAAALAGPRAALSEAVAAGGYRSASAFVASPTFGGASWLAHSTLLSGIRIADAGSYDALLTRSRDTLVQRFSDRGYRAVAVMPGLKRAWPEGSFYRFHRVYGEQDLDYRGPSFGWWRIPDQYALAKLHRLELSGGTRAPVFAFFPTITTHMPFNPIPPYQPDWEQLMREQPFAPERVRASLARTPDWTRLSPAYADAIGYSLTSIAGFLRIRRPRELLLVLVGDHQPAASVSGPGARWDVPVHLITRRPAVLQPLLAAGFEPGLNPRHPSSMPMHELAALLLGAFDAAPAEH